MEKEEIRLSIDQLIERNLPFVIFREPGKSARCVIQSSPLISNENVTIEKRGFYLFPFSEKEAQNPIFINPDMVLEWNNEKDKFLSLPKLPIPESASNQNLNEVSFEEYSDDLTHFLSEFPKRDIEKAIYSRVRKEEIPENFDLNKFYSALCNQYPKAFVYILNIPGNAIWLGASPELLLSYSQGEAKTVALAGTLKINRNLPAPEWTRKEIDEHRMVEKHIIDVCESMSIDYEKSTVRSSSTGKVYHLKSDFKLKVDAKEVVSFLNKIHPTPAISGLPQEAALDLIYETEKLERGYYCGFLGWIEDPEDFNLYINLRCMKKSNGNIYLFAGGGITPESNIQKEWEETEVKMSTISDLLPGNLTYSV